MVFFLTPKPKTFLDYQRILSPTGCLPSWEGRVCRCSKDTTFEILDNFWNAGGNFIDTSNNYQFEESEEPTKYTKYWLVMKKDPRVHSSFQGNHSKSLRVSVEDSLKKLQTNCIDIDYSTSIPEVMQSLNPLATAGKVLYLGVSDTPAWVVSKANHYARDHGLAQFMIYQGMWNAANCDLERDIISMCRDEGMAIAPWSALGSGQFKTVEQRKQPGGRATGPNSEKAIKISEVLEKIAKEKILSSLAMAYVLHRAPNVFLVIGGLNSAHLQGPIDALGISLTEEELEEIDDSSEFDSWFPQAFMFSFWGAKYDSRKNTKNVMLVQNASWLHIPEQDVNYQAPRMNQ
ncbi:Aldo/keto reductase [Patellaria atrata CBS 101060]|uniref:Aldo/keto reductase n=1 Tax=Patellaria atrata CBS 101060 TaxID=1346257 RepID=A0A9P4VQV4_9PEZI|nr:Aldo/keto reductase [Patellaria atrata CBS 101060]